MLEITSVTNEKIKEAARLKQKKYRNETGLFLIEGHKPIFEANCENAEICVVYTTKKHFEKFNFIKDKIVLVNEAIMEKISTTDSFCEAVAIAQQKKWKIENVKGKKRIALFENIKDAGNLGTLLRSAAAFEIEAILLCGDTIDHYNPKVVRSTVGALFKLPIVKTSLAQARETFKEHKLIATVVNQPNTVVPEKIDFLLPFVIMLGSEADGLSDEAIQNCDIKTTIPMSKNTESLNLSVAGSILFYLSSKK